MLSLWQYMGLTSASYTVCSAHNNMLTQSQWQWFNDTRWLWACMCVQWFSWVLYVDMHISVCAHTHTHTLTHTHTHTHCSSVMYHSCSRGKIIMVCARLTKCRYSCVHTLVLHVHCIWLEDTFLYTSNPVRLYNTNKHRILHEEAPVSHQVQAASLWFPRWISGCSTTSRHNDLLKHSSR